MRSKAKIKTLLGELKNTPKKWYIFGGLILMGIVLVGFAHRPAAQYKLQDTSKAIAVTADKCNNLNTRTQNSYSCYKKELNDIVSQTDPEHATSFIQQQYTSVAYVKSNCHQLMHIVGRAAYAKYNDLAETFTHGSQYCNGGYYHGLSEQLGNENGLAYLKQSANKLCMPIAAKKGRYSFYHYNCVHGMGHAFMEVTGGELFDSLSGCDLIKDSWERSSCYGGVFMQNIMIEQSPDDSVDHTSKYLKSDDPMYPCTAVQDKYKQQCYLMQTSHALLVEKYDFNAVFSLCNNADSAYQATCYTSMGRDASGQTVYNAQQTQSICLLGPTADAKSNCIQGALRDYVDNFQSDKQASALCDNLPEDMASACTTNLKSYISNF